MNKNSAKKIKIEQRGRSNYFQIGDKVRIAHGLKCNDRNWLNRDLHFVPETNRDKTIGVIGIVKKITHMGSNIEHIHASLDNTDVPAELYIQPCPPGIINTNSDINSCLENGLIIIESWDVVNYSVHGDQEGDRIFEQSRSQDLTWFDTVNRRSSGIIPNNIWANMDDISSSVELKAKILSTSDIFRTQAKYFYNRLFYDFLEVNRKYRKQKLVEALIKQETSTDG